MALSINDALSHANSEDYLTEHAYFYWLIDFDRKVIEGRIELTMTNISKKKADLRLDAKHLDIKDVLVQGINVTFLVSNDTVESLGSCLTIPINSLDEKLVITVMYCTTALCSALQWMTPEQTKGKKHPYMYSQCEAIHARSLFPCQDTPSVKFTYSAQVTAVSHLNVLMSAVKKYNVATTTDVNVHIFEQTIKIPSYLVAIVCANLKGRKIGPRSTVWSEPEMVDEAAVEFEDTEKFLCTGEELCGPYEWGVYDVLVLPPSFPFGGMENPCLTFVTPTLLVGDKSLIYVIAHEISHSWTGNLVTNKTWDDFWLNEGHTMYLEYLLMERYYKSAPMRQLLIRTGQAELKDAIRHYGEGSLFNQLVPHLERCDPDDAWSIVPYEKGQNLLFHLEMVCGKEKMLRWLKKYINTFKYRSLTTEEWKTFFYWHMTNNEDVEVTALDAVEWNQWFTGRGQIPVQLGDRCEHLAKRWNSPMTHSSQNELELVAEFDAMIPLQRYYFLRFLNDELEANLTEDKLNLMGRIYHFTESTNSEILLGWSLLCIRSRYEPALDQVFNFVNSQGRLRYQKPLYKNLYNWPEMRERTAANYQRMLPQLHPTTEKCIRQLLGL